MTAAVTTRKATLSPSVRDVFALAKPREGRRRFPRHHRRRTQRQQANQGADFQTHGGAIGQAEHIVEETVLFIPYAFLLFAQVIHGLEPSASGPRSRRGLKEWPCQDQARLPARG